MDSTLNQSWQRFLLSVCCFLLFAPFATGAWHETASPFRRVIHTDVDPQRITGDELANVRFLANGKQRPDAQDIYVTTMQGKVLPSRVINVGPGDLIDVAFNPVKGVQDYYAYFASGKAADQAEQLNTGGLMLEMKPLGGDMGSSPKEMQAAYGRITHVVGHKIIPRPFIGANVFGLGQPTMTRLTGKLFVPADGTYTFAVAAGERGALFIDGKPVVFCRHLVGDARFQDSVELTRGQHDFMLIQGHAGGEYVFSVAWRRPLTNTFEVIGREFFSPVLLGNAGPLEEQGKPLSADLAATYMGESFFSWNYSHRYRFDVQSTVKNPERMLVTWEFGDGQKAAGPQVEHVYLSPGIYTIRVTTKLAANTDTQAYRLNVDRDIDRIGSPPADELALQARFVAGYDLQKLTPETLAWAVLMQLHAGAPDEALKAAEQLAADPTHPNRSVATKAFQELHDDMLARKRPDQLRKVYAAVPSDSDMNPWLAVQHAKVLMYSLGEFRAALDVMKPFASADDAAKRTYAQALLLNGQLEKSKAILDALPVGAANQKAPALSGAMARTAEFYVTEKDAAAGEQALDKWMAAFPADFLDGNSAVMRVGLMQARGNTEAAARFAEAYANGNPQSAYSPKLLDTASHIMEKTDKAKSDALRKLLKERYPEDPLSQK